MLHSPKLFSVGTNPITINLPNESKVKATYIRTVKIGHEIPLKDVLFIPEFTYNLIYASRLVSSLDIEILFANNVL